MDLASARRGWGEGFFFLVAVASLVAMVGLGCSAGDAPGASGWSNPLTGAPEPATSGSVDAQTADSTQSGTVASSTGSSDAGATSGDASAAVGGNASTAVVWLITTADLNLRTGPGTSYAILRVIPKGSLVQLLDPTPVNGFLHVDHQGLTGWASSTYLVVQNVGGEGGTVGGAGLDAGGTATDGGPSQPASAVIASAIDRAKSGLGFSYWWGHGVWLPTGPTTSNAGSCSGSCPNCTHTGSYGADCSGYVGQIWQVPASNNDITVDKHPYSTADFVNDTSLWSTVSQGSVKLGDAFVYNQSGSGHIFIYAAGDGWGAMDAYECKGCATGCVFDNRTAGSAYHSIRRTGW
jgi:cell wall-associated NlpC family hydrolase